MMTHDEMAIAGLAREFAVFFRQDPAALGQRGRETPLEFRTGAYGLLAHLFEHGPHRATDLADQIGLAPSTISRHLQPLETLGLITRFPDPDDGRAFSVTLTEKGRCRIAEVQRLRSKRLGEILESWSEHDVRTFAGLLARFNGSAGPAQHFGSAIGNVRSGCDGS
ncbi:MarR family transcriptional regulator [Amycolatopsis rhabdoformis]|uniref:MarR family transcriptional regulator n=1 Tax=Amycolatopsis rhabdoformis TaxID=1448059 RepID=A0ABZ1IDS2_9PSEU|nr:MarR family transcriptional regulator [Amycolatopsis rhabdoformis]WSE32308.1 MarR family transcriptional regulator [Amycolatopsis rhabdoformis]